MASRYAAGMGWDAPAAISNMTGDAVDVRLAMDAEGHALAAWLQLSNGVYDLWTNRFTPDSGWSAAERIEDEPGDVTTHTVAVGGDGAVIVAWAQYEGADGGARSRRYRTATGWGPVRTIDTPANAVVSSPRIAIKGDDDAVAVWLRTEAGSTRVAASRFE